LVNLQSKFSKYRLEAVNDKQMDHGSVSCWFAPKLGIISWKEEANYIDIICQFPRKSFREFWVGIGGEFPYISKEASTFCFLRNILPVRHRISAVAAIKAKYHSAMNLENYLRAAISKLQPRYVKLCSKR
jgi:hypothetical protein